MIRSRLLVARRSEGFTLVELLIVIAIVGILAVVAIPAYQHYLIEARRTNAVSLLLQAASAEQRYYTVNNGYTTNLSALGFSATAQKAGIASTTSHYYSMTVTSTSPASFTLTATPENAQKADTECGTFSINALGHESVTGTDTAQHCWQ